MTRPVVLIHGYSADWKTFEPLRKALAERGVVQTDINICNYISLNNEITIKDIAEGLERAFRNHPILKDDNQPFDAIVHSTGMLVLRSWLINAGLRPEENHRLKRLKHLVGLAPATWGSPQAHKGRTWLGTLVKGNRKIGPDFLNAGDRVLEGLELGSKFTWDLAHADLLGPAPFYDTSQDTPYVAVFIGNTPYDGLSSVANDPGTDGTVRWAGAGLNTRKITIDLTRKPDNATANRSHRVTISPWANNRLDVPIIAVDGRNHSSLLSDPDSQMVGHIFDFLKTGDEGGKSFDDWLTGARQYGEKGKKKMLMNPGAGAVDLVGEAKALLDHFIGREVGTDMDGWQQFVVHARDERGDGVSDYMIEVLRKEGDSWQPFTEMYVDVHPYGPDPSYRCFQIRLPRGILAGEVPLQVRVHASTGTELMAYQGYGDNAQQLTAESAPVELDLGAMNKSLFHPFTTTLIEVILNREPLPFNSVSRILQFE
jgi:pimeloyl-ACP methyl ester carboxylesterase